MFIPSPFLFTYNNYYSKKKKEEKEVKKTPPKTKYKVLETITKSDGTITKTEYIFNTEEEAQNFMKKEI